MYDNEIEKLFDELHYGEKENFKFLRAFLGDSLQLLPLLFRLHETFFRLAIPQLSKFESVEQKGALVHAIGVLSYEALAFTNTLMRGQASDASQFSRRSIELCAFIVEMYRDESSAQRWLNVTDSKGSMERYLSRFSAWGLVRKHLPDKLQQLYEFDCLAVHPSFMAITQRSSILPDSFYALHLFELDQSNEKSVLFFEARFFNIFVCHVNILDVLIKEFGLIDQSEWQTEHKSFVDSYRHHTGQSEFDRCGSIEPR